MYTNPSNASTFITLLYFIVPTMTAF